MKTLISKNFYSGEKSFFQAFRAQANFCELCGSKKKVEAHHVFPRFQRDGSEENIVAYAYVGLCSYHHGWVHQSQYKRNGFSNHGLKGIHALQLWLLERASNINESRENALHYAKLYLQTKGVFFDYKHERFPKICSGAFFLGSSGIGKSFVEKSGKTVFLTQTKDQSGKVWTKFHKTKEAKAEYESALNICPLLKDLKWITDKPPS